MYRINIKNHGGTQYKTNAYTEGREIFIWREDEDNDRSYDAGWYACIRGVGPTGLYSETDDVGPFDGPEAAGMEAIDMLEIDHENDLETAAERGEDTTELAAEQQAIIEYVTAQVSLLGTMTTRPVADEHDFRIYIKTDADGSTFARIWVKIPGYTGFHPAVAGWTKNLTGMTFVEEMRTISGMVQDYIDAYDDLYNTIRFHGAHYI